MHTTTTTGRIDIVIFPNGGREVIGRIPSEPPTKESIYMPHVKEFVEMNQGLEKPKKFTGYYDVTNGNCTFTWGDYAGEIERPEEKEVDLEDMFSKISTSF